MTSTDKDLSLTPLKGNSGKAYMGTYPNGDRVFVKMNTTPILAALAKEQIAPQELWWDLFLGKSCQGTDCTTALVG